MKKIYFSLLLIGGILFNTCKAQYVTIPDAVFVTWLQNNGFASCMNGNQMDTTCAALFDSIQINCSNVAIRDLTGVQYFKNLIGLGCAFDSLYTIPALPKSLQLMNCQSNNLTSLPALPPGMRVILCDNNYLDTLPTLPDTLNGLSCNYNHLVRLPALPDSLERLLCNNNQLSTLPALPAGLTNLGCSNNNLTSIPTLPDSLNSFICNSNPNLTCLPLLNTVVYMQFFGTAVTCLPNYGNVGFSSPAVYTLPICGVSDTSACLSMRNIRGLCYYDQNNNCIFDNIDLGLNYIKVQLYNGGVLKQQVFTSTGGKYFFAAPPDSNYTVQIDTTLQPLKSSCPDSGYYSISVPAVDSISANNNFALKCSLNGFDIGVRSIINYGAAPTPNANIGVKAVAGDLSQLFGSSCAAGVSGKVQLIFNGPVNYTGPALGALNPSSISGDTITWNIADFGPVNALTAFNLNFHVSAGAGLGAQICFTVNVTPLNGDFNQSNNTGNYCFEVVNAMASQEKEVYPTDFVASTDQWLTYTIKFQNVGSSTATNIRITDQLDSNLDPSTFQILAYSASNVTQLFGRSVVFSFPNINLPDSLASSTLSRGYVQYKIKMLQNTLAGTQVHNSANVYFGSNGAIVTNTTTNTLCSTASTGMGLTITCGDSVNFNGHFYHLSGTYSDTLLTARGCDSVSTLYLTVIGDSISRFDTICSGDSLNFYGENISAPGNYTVVLAGNLSCDTFVALHLTVLSPIPTTYIYDTICQGDSVAFNSGFADTTGTYLAHLNSHNGCDSVVSLQLLVKPSQFTILYDTICAGDTMVYDGYHISTTNIYGFQFTNAQGCDSIIAINLYVRAPVSNTYIYDTICSGDSVAFQGGYYHSSGTYPVHIGNQFGCDSLVTLNLNVIPPVPVTNLYDTLCQGDSAAFNGGYFDATGNFTAHLTAQTGCDSMVVLNLTVYPLPVVNFSWAYLVSQGYLLDYNTDTVWCVFQPLHIMPLAGGTPFGGVYTGMAVNNGAIYADSINTNSFMFPGLIDTIAYTVTLNGCSTSVTDTLHIEICEGINDINADNLFTIYPNPAKDYVILETNPEAIGNTVRFTDITGREVVGLQITGYKLQVNTNGFAAGVYFVTLNDRSGRRATRKLVIQ